MNEFDLFSNEFPRIPPFSLDPLLSFCGYFVFALFVMIDLVIFMDYDLLIVLMSDLGRGGVMKK